MEQLGNLLTRQAQLLWTDNHDKVSESLWRDDAVSYMKEGLNLLGKTV